MIVVSNTSPVINLFTIDKIELLYQLYGEIIIPVAVYNEIVVCGAGKAGSREVQTAEWIKPVMVKDKALVRALQTELDPGEAEAIALAVELHSDLLLMDERQGRIFASSLGLKCIGVLGVLVASKQRNYIEKIKPHLDNMIVRAGFWISRSLYKRVLEISGE